MKITPANSTSNVGVLDVTASTNDAAAELRLTADTDGRDNKDRWRLLAENENAGLGGEVKLQSKESDSWVDKMTITNAGVLTASSFSGGINSEVISSALDQNTALTLSTNRGGIHITAGGDGALDDLDIAATGVATEMRLTSESDQPDAIQLDATVGGVDIDAKKVLALDGEDGIDIGKENRVAVGIESAGLTVNANAASSIVTSVGGLTLTTEAQAQEGADNIAVYSFALKPEEHQPSGTCNFSRIDNAQLVTSVNPLGRNLNIYAVNYNVLRIMSGMGGLAYSN